MRISIIGYGKMGKAIQQIALQHGHSIAHIIELPEELEAVSASDTDVAIEFTQPEAAYENIKTCISKGIPVISGTTGWLDRYQELTDLAVEKKATFLYASNFSIGVNLFFELNAWLAKRMNHLDFTPSMEEVHHTEKKDSPSGTALTLAEGILEHISSLSNWINQKSADRKTLGIVSKRIPNVPGTHIVSYESPLESISIEHEAKDRSVFAEGAVMVANWIKDKKGVFTMSDFINQQ